MRIGISLVAAALFAAACGDVKITDTILTVSFDSRGGSELDSLTVEPGSRIDPPAHPRLSGCDFTGWFREPAGLVAWNFTNDTVTSNLTLYAQWHTNFCTIVYDGNGHTGGALPVTTTNFRMLETVTLPGNTGYLVRINAGGVSYRFSGWNPQADGNGPLYPEDGSFVIASNTRFYARWVPYKLRDTGPAGGLVFHVKADYTDGWRYLEAAPADLGANIAWDSSYYFLNKTGLGIGSGLSNTINITNRSGHSPASAANRCLAHTRTAGIVYADWFLPSRDELKAMYDNLKMSGKGSFDTGPLTAYYWSSSEDSSSKAWYILFADGVASTNDKDLVSRVRAARRF